MARKNNYLTPDASGPDAMMKSTWSKQCKKAQVMFDNVIAPSPPMGTVEEQVHVSHTHEPSSRYGWKHYKAFMSF